MAVKKIIIVGAGFAGIACAKKLASYKEDFEVTLIDKQTHADFLPLLPDIIGRGLRPEYLSFPIGTLSSKYNFVFINSEVAKLQFKERKVHTTCGIFDFDYLVLASGSETNFYGNDLIRYFAHKLDNVEDAIKLIKAVQENKADFFIVSGGGYTGIEIATNLRKYFTKKKQYKKIIIVEAGASILGPLPQWMKDYCNRNLEKMHIDVFLNSSVENITDKEIVLTGERKLINYCLIWSAGVTTSGIINYNGFEKDRQGRLKVDEFLRLNNRCFAAGDAASFNVSEKPLRMAVQFSILEGEIAAENVYRTIYSKPLKAYKPVDLGYIVPMANNSSCGIVLGKKVRGWFATFFHYVMCVYRSSGLRNKLGIIRNLLCGF